MVDAKWMGVDDDVRGLEIAMGLTRREHELDGADAAGRQGGESSSGAGLAELTSQGNQAVARRMGTSASPFKATAPPGATLARKPKPKSEEDGGNGYPGDKAGKAAVAQWMARGAQAAGLPGELPVMAALVESNLKNVNYGDRDSLGYFQMRTSIWNTGKYKGYPSKPHLQLQWFIDEASRVRNGRSNKNARQFGEWCADTERPAEQYRYRYQTRLGEARELIGSDVSKKPDDDKQDDEKKGPKRGGVYTVVKGDTLWDISRRHGMTLAELLAINPHFRKNPDLIFPGQKVYLKGGGKQDKKDKDKGKDKKPPPGKHGDVAALAASFIGRNASELKRSKDLPMNPNVPSNICCANFVTAVLEKAGLFKKGDHTDSVSVLKNTLEKKGWKAFKDKSRARPGDVWTNKVGGSHTEIVYSNDGGNLRLVGSNNVNDDGTQRISYGKSYGSPVFYSPPD